MREAIILAGGFGTRLQSVVNDRPKCMAIVADKPFLTYLFNYLEQNRFDHIILSLGYKADMVIDWLSTISYSFEVSYVIEEDPLGTGGAIKYAARKLKGDDVFVLNGDTFFDVNIDTMFSFYKEKQTSITLALKPLSNFDRYGCVSVDADSKIEHFEEKKICRKGLD